MTTASIILAVILAACPDADFNKDGAVDAIDQAHLMGCWNEPCADLDGDGTTGSSDLAVLVGCWGSMAVEFPDTLDETFEIVEPGVYTGRVVWNGVADDTIIEIKAAGVTLRDCVFVVSGDLVYNNKVRAVDVRGDDCTFERVEMWGTWEGAKLYNVSDFLARECIINTLGYSFPIVSGERITITDSRIKAVSKMCVRAGLNGDIPTKDLTIRRTVFRSDSKTMFRLGCVDGFLVEECEFHGFPDCSSVDIAHDGRASTGRIVDCEFHEAQVWLKASAFEFEVDGDFFLVVKTPAVKAKSTKPAEGQEQVIKDGVIRVRANYADGEPDKIVDLEAEGVRVENIQVEALP